MSRWGPGRNNSLPKKKKKDKTKKIKRRLNATTHFPATADWWCGTIGNDFILKMKIKKNRADFRLKCFFFLWGARRGFTDRLRDPIETALPYFGNFSQKNGANFLAQRGRFPNGTGKMAPPVERCYWRMRWLTWANERKRWKSLCCALAAASESAGVEL